MSSRGDRACVSITARHCDSFAHAVQPELDRQSSPRAEDIPPLKVSRFSLLCVDVLSLAAGALLGVFTGALLGVFMDSDGRILFRVVLVLPSRRMSWRRCEYATTVLEMCPYMFETCSARILAKLLVTFASVTSLTNFMLAAKRASANFSSSCC